MNKIALALVLLSVLPLAHARGQREARTVIVNGEEYEASRSGRLYPVEPAQTGGGAIDPRTGAYYPNVGPGVINPSNGNFYPDIGPGYIDPQNGAFMPKY